MEKFDLIVIGSGPGGYVGAIRAAQLGKKVAIVEKRKTLGGTCLNVGCIPSKALLDSSEEYHKALHKLKDHGIQTGSVQIDINKMMSRKDQVVKEVCDGVDFLMNKNKIKKFIGSGKFKTKNEIIITKDDKTQEIIEGTDILIATGSVPIEIPGAKIDGEVIITSDHAINLKSVPKSMVIIGAGVIGLELGSVWNRLGADVTIVELLPRLFQTADKQISSLTQRILESQGMKFLFEHKVLEVIKKGKKAIVKIEDNAKNPKEIEADIVLVAIGRRPFYDNLGIEELGVQLTNRKRIQVDFHFKTSIENIYAIGDVIEGPMLAHKAEEEGIAVAEILSGKSGHVNYNSVPSIVYTWPEIAWVGLGEEELKEKGIAYKVGKSFFKANARSKAMNEQEGQVKILAHKDTDKLLGVYIIGPRASDMIAEIAVAFEFGASAEDIARSFHAHPTLAEIVKEACMSVDGWAIHS